jgi:hypothetical protein
LSFHNRLLQVSMPVDMSQCLDSYRPRRTYKTADTTAINTISPVDTMHYQRTILNRMVNV